MVRRFEGSGGILSGFLSVRNMTKVIAPGMKTASRSSCGLQDDHAQRWDRDFDVCWPAHPLAACRLQGSAVAEVAAAVERGVGVEDFDVFAGQGYAEAIADLWLRRKVGRDDDKASIVPPGQPGEYGVFGVVALLPWSSRAFGVIYDLHHLQLTHIRQ